VREGALELLGFM